MIAYIKGKVRMKTGNFLVIEAGDIGYKVFAPADVLLKTKQDDEVALFTHQHVREDAIQLFGFLKFEELNLFEQLISVSGIGPKTALAVFAEAKLEDIISAIVNGDASILKRVSGIGSKTAERIVLELKNKIAAGAAIENIKTGQELGADADAVEALVSLGYSVSQSREALKRVSVEITDAGEKVREALKNI